MEDFERAVLVAVNTDKMKDGECETSLAELERLLDTAGGSVFAKMVQSLDAPNHRTCIGSGKLIELSGLCKNNDIKLVIFDLELSPMQIRNIEDGIDCDVRVLDRSMLILDIFALHAVSGEGKLQVELAQLRYSAPRLMGHGTELSRLGGGIGTRGPGETKLETDRRHLKEKIATLERRLAEMEHNRAIMRAQRDRSGLAKIAIVGYTNAGKSTLLNALTGAGVLSEDKLFATLDPTTRKLELPSGESILLTDTVGFIRKLPHHLVKAFKSTLDEVSYADMLLVVTDITDPEAAEHVRVTEEVIEELGASEKPVIYVYNKCDLLDSVPEDSDGAVMVSGATGAGLDSLVSRLEAYLHSLKKRYKLRVPYSEQGILSAIYDSYTAENVDYTEDGVTFEAILDERGRGMYGKYIVE